MQEIARLCDMLDDRSLIHAICAAIDRREMFKDDMLILRLRLDQMYRTRYNKSVD